MTTTTRRRPRREARPRLRLTEADALVRVISSATLDRAQAGREIMSHLAGLYGQHFRVLTMTRKVEDGGWDAHYRVWGADLYMEQIGR